MVSQAKDRGLEGRVVFVTGAGRGIGRAITLALAASGAVPALADISLSALQDVSEELEASGAEFRVYAADVTDPQAVSRAVQAAFDEFGRLDGAVNNAGILGAMADIHAYPGDVFRNVLDVNTVGVFNCLQAELQVMLTQGWGAIVNVASVAGLVGWERASAYVAAKHAVVGLTRNAGLEYGARNIRVNSVCPAFIYSELIGDIIADEGSHAAVVDAIPAHRIGQADEVAESVLWLLSDRSSFAVGTNLTIDGAYTAR